MATKEIVPAAVGKRYLTREHGIVGPLWVEAEPDHLTDGKRAWHWHGDCCGDAAFDLIEELK